MMKKLLSIILCAASITANAQYLQLESGPFNKVLRKAQSENKPICVFFIPAKSVPVPKGFIDVRKSTRLGSYFRDKFICYAPDVKDTSFQFLLKKFKVQRVPAFIYTDTGGNLIAKKSEMLKSEDPIIRNTETVLEKIRSGRTLSWYESEYKNGRRDTSFLKKYILEREGSEIFTNQLLIEEYAKQFPMQELNTFDQTAFILQAGPVYDSPLYQLIHSNMKVVDSVYQSLPLALRSEINQRISGNTLAEAIRLKSNTLLNKADEHIRRLCQNSNNYRYTNFLVDDARLTYYRAVKDSIRLLSTLSYHVDYYFYSVKPDTFAIYKKKFPDLAKSLSEEKLEKPPLGDPAVQATFANYINARYIIIAPIELNNAAWEVYKQKTQAMDYLLKAMLWSRRSIELDPQAAYYDTLAHLLYRVQFYAEAEQTQLKAIKLADAGPQKQRLKQELNLMKSRRL